MTPTDRDERAVVHALHDAPPGPDLVEGQRAFARLMLKLRAFERARRDEDQTQETPIPPERDR